MVSKNECVAQLSYYTGVGGARLRPYLKSTYNNSEGETMNLIIYMLLMPLTAASLPIHA